MRIYESNDALKIISMPREASVQCVVKQAFSVVWLQFMFFFLNVAEQRKTKKAIKYKQSCHTVWCVSTQKKISTLFTGQSLVWYKSVVLD